MKRGLVSAVALVLLGVPAVRADLPPPPPPPPPKSTQLKPDTDADPAPVVAGAAGLVLAGAWLARSRRRIVPQS